MSVMLITYDDGKSDGSVDWIPVIMDGFKHMKLSENTYAIETHEKTHAIFNKIRPYLGCNAHLLIITLTKPFTSPEEFDTEDDNVT